MRLNIVYVWSLHHLKQVIILLRLLLNDVRHLLVFSHRMTIVTAHVCHKDVGGEFTFRHCHSHWCL